MPNVTVFFGVLLCAVSAMGYFRSVSDSPSPTLFIPAGFGIVLIVLGILARKPNLRMHLMHAAVTVGLIGFLIPAWRMTKFKLGDFLTDDPTANRAPRLMFMMALVCLMFVTTCIFSFIAARKRRKAEGTT